MAMLAGVLGCLVLAGLFTANFQAGEEGASLRAGWGRAVLWFSAVHVLIMGFSGWLAPSGWPGYLPPITLWSFVMALYFLLARGRRGT